MLYLCLFGHLSVANCDGPAPWPSIDLSGRPGSLLAYLALARGRFFARGELLTALWPDQAETCSLQSFNTALWRLRKALARPPLAQQEIVVCDKRGAVGLPLEAKLRVDVDEFSRLVAPGLAKPMEQLDESHIDQLRRGVAMYRDDILAGFTDDWALRVREMHRRTLFNALARLMQVSTLAQDYAAAIGHAQAILDRDPLREDVHRELMRLFMLHGQRALALQQFELCRNALRKELAIEPMRETMAAYQQIADSAVGRNSGPVPPMPFQWQIRPPQVTEPQPGYRPVGCEDATHLSPRELIARAQWYLAQADSKLERHGDDADRHPLA
jgi:DNA-binding SARP family transcriptional activator